MTNQFVESLLDKAKDRFSIDSGNMPMAEWVCKNTTLRNRPFSMKGYEFQEQIMNDMHPNLSVIKISQVGMTEVQLRKALGFLLRNTGTSLIFSEPNEDMAKRVSNARIKPLINKEPVFNSAMDKEGKSVRSVDMYQFNQSFMYVTPAIESAATSIPADAVFIDEIDLSDQKIVSLYSSRLQNSKFKISQAFSTPSFPAYGSDLNWQASDQHLYMIQCQCCGHWSHPEFDWKYIHLEGFDRSLVNNVTDITENFKESIQFENSYVKCERCEKPLDLSNPEFRRWVANYPSRKSDRGYRIGPFSSGKLDLPYIFTSMWKYRKNEYMRGFYNTVLGQAYSDGTIQIPEKDIEACMTNNVNQPETTNIDDLWVGIDVGQTCHITLGRGPDGDNLEILCIYTKHIDDLVDHCKELVKTYNIRGGAIDRHPYEPTASEVFKVTEGRIVPVEYRGLKDMNLVDDPYGNFDHAQVNHTSFLDNFATKIRKHTIKISGYGFQKSILIQHYRDMVRDEKPGEPAKWIKLTGNDHYLHSGAFMAIAPHIQTLVRLRSDEDERTCVLSTTSMINDGTNNLIGVYNKKVDKPFYRK